MVSLQPGATLGRYRVYQQLGRGGMATVFRCHDPNLDRFVAVKVLPSYHTDDPSFLGRFAQEARTVASLSSANILQIYDFGEDKGFTYIVTELVPGGTLQDKLTGDPLPIEEVLWYMKPLAQALDYAHSEGIIHRDLKPANVLLTEDANPVLADFGLARMLESATRFTQGNQALGTPEYMAPEQAMGGDADKLSDLYSFGILLYQMILGMVPFQADTPAATLMAHVHRPLPLPSLLKPDLDPRIEGLLLKAVAKEPADRYTTASEMIGDLEAAAGLGDGPGMRPVARPQASQPAAAGKSKSSRFPKMLMAAGIVVVLALVVVVVFWFFLRGISPSQALAQAAGSVGLGGVTCPAAEDSRGRDSGSTAEALSRLQELQDRAHRQVAELRQIQDPPPVTAVLRTQDELCEITKDFYRRREVRDQLFEAEELYKALGLMPEAQSLEQVLINIQLQRVTALFDDVSGDVYVLSDAAYITPKFEVGYASAYMGGLQQQLFDIIGLRNRARATTGDRFRAVGALIVGDVSVVADGYTQTVMADDLEELNRPIANASLAQAPQIVRKTVLFPQVEGGRFVQDIFAEANSWVNVNRAYRDPPISTEQVIHPEKYLSNELPVEITIPNLVPLMGGEWSLTAVDTMGEFVLRSYLEEYLPSEEAAAAADGWGGDQFQLMSSPEMGRLLVAKIEFDSVSEANEFYGAFKTFMTAATGGTDTQPEPISGGNRWVVDMGKTVFLGESPPGALLIVVDTPDAAARGLSAFNQASAGAQGLP